MTKYTAEESNSLILTGFRKANMRAFVYSSCQVYTVTKCALYEI